jgi:hypothetical protein
MGTPIFFSIRTACDAMFIRVFEEFLFSYFSIRKSYVEEFNTFWLESAVAGGMIVSRPIRRKQMAGFESDFCVVGREERGGRVLGWRRELVGAETRHGGQARVSVPQKTERVLALSSRRRQNPFIKAPFRGEIRPRLKLARRGFKIVKGCLWTSRPRRGCLIQGL